MTKQEWLAEAERLLQERYHITLADCTDAGEPAPSWFDEAPSTFVAHVGYKYNLHELGDGW